MIRLPQFEIEMPTTIVGVTNALAHSGARVLAGGSDLIVNIKHGMQQSDRIVWLGKIPELKQMTYSGDGLRIGAMCTLADLATSEVVRNWQPALVNAVLSIASPAIRNSATVGGNLCLDTRCIYYDQSEFWRCALDGCLKLSIKSGDGDCICHAAPASETCAAVFSSDLAPILIALGASIHLVGPGGGRRTALENLYRNDGRNHLTLEPGEILVDVQVPPTQPGTRSIHRKIRSRSSIDFPQANIGLSICLDSRKICTDAKIIVGAVGSAPVRAEGTEALLRNSTLTDRTIEMAAEEAADVVHPLPNMDASVGYRKRMVEALVRGALEELQT